MGRLDCRWALVVSFACALPTFASAEETPRVAIGDAIDPSLSFKDIRYLPRDFKDFGPKKAIVAVFVNTTCPLVQRYLPKLKRLDEEYRDKGVQFVAVNVGMTESIVAMAAQAVDFDIPFPFVKDFGGDLAKALGVRRTPEVVILDGEYRLRYRGRIDDQYRFGGIRPSVTNDDLKNAIEDVLAGKDVRMPETPVDGCLITFGKPKVAVKTVTYAEHVAPLLKKHCQDCHRDNGGAPFALTTYDQARANADMLGEVVHDQRMPPWYASPEHGQFVNAMGMSPEERETVARWVREGLPAGDLSKAPEPIPGNPSHWIIGKPDLVIQATQSHDLPADGYIPYKYVILPHIFPHDTWVQAIEITADNPRVLHHCNMAYVRIGEKFQDGKNFLGGKIPGGQPIVYHNNIGTMIPKGSMLALQIHYTTTGQPEKCRVGVGFRFAKEVINKQLHFFQMHGAGFAIEPENPHFKIVADRVVERDATGLGMFAHMHLRGKDMTFIAHYPDGKDETLLSIPNYNFEWQMGYEWPANQQRFPKGTRVECVAHYDNSSFNPYNPDPKKTVREGDQTFDEMMFGFVFLTYDDENLQLKIDPNTGKVISAGGN